MSHATVSINILGDWPVIVDIGGEGRYPRAWNVNPSKLKTLGQCRGEPIPRHIPGRAEKLPLPDGCVDFVIVERTPLRLAALHEIARIVSVSGMVILRHASLPGQDCHKAAKEIIRGLVSQQTAELGRQFIQESVFCSNRNWVNDLESLKDLALERRA